MLLQSNFLFLVSVIAEKAIVLVLSLGAMQGIYGKMPQARAAAL
jgi:hypothetical protein